MIEAGINYSLKEQLIIRDKLLRECNFDPAFKRLCLALAKKDVVFWVNNFVFTYDPRRVPSMIPFVLFPKQIEYLQWRQERRSLKEHGLIEKSRDMGLTWLNVAYQTHCWLFENNFKGGFGSRKEMLVDRKGDPDSIFEKIRIILRNLPLWMLPKGFKWDEHDNYLRMINPDTGSSITGEAGDSLGRGGRNALYDVDEFAFIERADSVDAALSQNTDVIFYTSTPNGLGNCYSKKRFSRKIPVFTFRWQDDPRKDDAWYQKQKNNLDPVILAQEVECDYTASVEGIYIPAKWVLAAVNLDIPAVGIPKAALDVASFGANRSVFGVRQGCVVTHIESWQGVGTTQTAFKVKDLMMQYQATNLNFDADGVGEGVGSTLEACRNELGENEYFPFTFIPLHGASSPSDRYWIGEQRTSKEKFHNARAEWWGLLRERFQKTYEHVNNIKAYELDELISIPNVPELISQLSLPKRKYTSTGKLLVESKEDMRKRGIDSPDFADCLVMLYAPTETALEITNAWLS
jgi:phage terminase large subunit